jgi:hypothetical protein
MVFAATGAASEMVSVRKFRGVSRGKSKYSAKVREISSIILAIGAPQGLFVTNMKFCNEPLEIWVLCRKRFDIGSIDPHGAERDKALGRVQIENRDAMANFKRRTDPIQRTGVGFTRVSPIAANTSPRLSLVQGLARPSIK